MPDNTARLGLPFIMPAQAQKHVTHNEALMALDALVQMRIEAFDLAAPPAEPRDGALYHVAAGASGAFANQDGTIAQSDGAGWRFLVPQAGWQAFDAAAGSLKVFDGAAWIGSEASFQNVDRIGVGTAADAVNRLAVSSDATLLSHAGGDHRLTVNRDGPGDTASLVFQSGWTGHAEMGLAGDTAFSVKVSADGTTWRDALRADAGPQTLTTDFRIAGQAVQQAADDATSGRLMRADFGFSPANLLGTVALSGAMPTGAVIETGTTAQGRYTRFADGTQIAMISGASLVANNNKKADWTWAFPADFAAPPVVAVQAPVDAGDWSEGAARFEVAIAGTSSVTTSSATLVVLFSVNQSVTVSNVGAIAVGRWA